MRKLRKLFNNDETNDNKNLHTLMGIEIEKFFVDGFQAVIYDSYEKHFYEGYLIPELEKKVKSYIMQKYNYTEKELEESVKQYRERKELLEKDSISWLSISEEHKNIFRKYLENPWESTIRLMDKKGEISYPCILLGAKKKLRLIKLRRINNGKPTRM